MSNKRAILVWVCLAGAFFASAACGGGGGNGNSNGGAGGESGAAIKRDVKPEADREAAVIETDFGRIVIELYPNIAPQMVERFKTLVRTNFYDGTTFHRINDAIVQGGDPLSKDKNPMNDGTGKSDYPDVPAEFSDVLYTRGIVGAARTQAPNTANCQFFITLTKQTAFDERYTVFGRVVEGIDTAGIISNAQVRTGTENPVDPIYMKRVTLRPRSDFAKP